MDSAAVLEKIRQSKYLNKGCTVSITGGEPFLKKGISEFILGLTNDPDFDVYVNITTSGYFTNRIQELAKKISDPSKICFSVSLDGLESTHEAIRNTPNAYKRAIESIQALAKNNIKVEINTVMQKDNLPELSYIQKLVDNMGGSVKLTCVPYTISASFDKVFPYEDSDIPLIFPRLRTMSDKEYVLTKGKYLIKNCHAGHRNIVIDPLGDIYPCNYGCSYVSADIKNEYYIGSLSDKSLDEVLTSPARENVIKNTVNMCTGCNANCDMYREEHYGNFHGVFTRDKARWIMSCYKSKPPVVYDFGWDNIVQDGDLEYRWMVQKEVSVFIYDDNLSDGFITVKYRNIVETVNGKPLVLTIRSASNGVSAECSVGISSISMPVSRNDVDRGLLELTFKTSDMWSPYELLGVEDHRYLGVALVEIEYQSNKI